MGPVTLPTSGRVYVDTQILVYTVEQHPVFSPLLRPFWASVHSGAVEAVTSELTILEMLVLPTRHGQSEMVARFEQFVAQPGLTLVPIYQPILRRAAALRADMQRLRTADAIHVATSIVSQCSNLLTNDRGLRGLPSVESVLLEDLMG